MDRRTTEIPLDRMMKGRRPRNDTEIVRAVTCGFIRRGSLGDRQCIVGRGSNADSRGQLQPELETPNWEVSEAEMPEKR